MTNTRDYFHVLVLAEGDKEPEVELDLDGQQLSERFLQPYIYDDALFIDGRVIPRDRVRKFRVWRGHAPISLTITKEKFRETVMNGGIAAFFEAQVIGVDVTEVLLRAHPGFSAMVTRNASGAKGNEDAHVRARVDDVLEESGAVATVASALIQDEELRRRCADLFARDGRLDTVDPAT